jgi:hypothetical protein
MSGNTILKLASAGLIGATLIGTGTSAMAAPMGVAPKAAVAASSPVTDVQWRRWGGGWGYRRGWGGGWGGPALGAAIGLGVLGAAAAASTPYYYGYPAYGYGYGYGYPGYYYGYPY